MVATISSTVDVGSATAFFAALGNTLHPALAKAALRGAQFATGEIRSTLQSDGTHKRGGLARSFKEQLVGQGSGVIAAESYSELVYARKQEEGGKISGKNGRRLAVPFKGVNLPPGKWPRHFPKTGPNALHLIPRGNKPPMLVQKRGGKNSERWVPIFILKTSVMIKAKHYVARTATRIAPAVQSIVADAVQDAIRGASR